jgi:glucose/arabinose dehydrogenase
MNTSSRVVILICFIATYVLFAGCIGTGPSSGINIRTPAQTQDQVPDNSFDLTNQNSPLASSYQTGNSFTPLGTPSPSIGLQKIASGFSAPMMIAIPDDETGWMYIVDQIGIVKIIDANGTVLPDPFLDIRDRMVALNAGYDERGLLSITFHPDFRNNGRIFVYYSAPLRPGGPPGWSCTNRLSEFRVLSRNPGKVDMASEKILLSIDKPAENHNGGPVLFGPDDGYLYLALGDGGGADDSGAGHASGTGNAQDPSTLLGKIIRIDVDKPGVAGKPYAIPPDNPFIKEPGFHPEIYAMGFRNPAYMSFDQGADHHLITAVAGQNLFEPVYIVLKGGNYGWNIREGTHCFNPANDQSPPEGGCPVVDSRGQFLVGPVIELGHDVGSVVIGGYIYRGADMPEFNGSYIFGDWSGTGTGGGSGRIFISSPPLGYMISMYPSSIGALTPQDNRMWSTREFNIVNNPGGRIGLFVRGFGEDSHHEVYLLTNSATGPDPAGTSGTIWKLVPPDNFFHS